MKLFQSLKQKNILKSEIAEISRQIPSSVSVMEENDYDNVTADLLKSYQDKTNELIALKVKIQMANAPILQKIYQISELKGMLNILMSIEASIKIGVHHSYGETPMKYKSQMTKAEVRTKIEEAKKMIQGIQDEIDAFNATTDIA